MFPRESYGPSSKAATDPPPCRHVLGGSARNDSSKWLVGGVDLPLVPMMQLHTAAPPGLLAVLVRVNTEAKKDCCSSLVVFDFVPNPTDILKAMGPMLMPVECFSQGRHVLIACTHHSLDDQLYLPCALHELHLMLRERAIRAQSGNFFLHWSRAGHDPTVSKAVSAATQRHHRGCYCFEFRVGLWGTRPGPSSASPAAQQTSPEATG